ncbi:MAG: FAD-dependent oxidoreductase, partial [Actinomycetota bacterium]
IRYASVALICFAFAPGHDWPEGSGFLVPRRENRLITACTFYSQKWPADGNLFLVRCSVGRIDDERWMSMDERKLEELVLGELREIVGVKAQPQHTKTIRWNNSFPQYNVGHAERVTRTRSILPPGISVAGAAFDGVGIPACIRQGKQAADEIDSFL